MTIEYGDYRRTGIARKLQKREGKKDGNILFSDSKLTKSAGPSSKHPFKESKLSLDHDRLLTKEIEKLISFEIPGRNSMNSQYCRFI